MSSPGIPMATRAPPHLDIDPFAIDFLDDPYPARELLRETAAAVYLHKWNVFGVARYAEVHAMLNAVRGRIFAGEAAATASPLP